MGSVSAKLDTKLGQIILQGQFEMVKILLTILIIQWLSRFVALLHYTKIFLSIVIDCH